MRRTAVFLDRDGTLIEEVGYPDRLDRLRPYPWSVDAVRLLNRAGHLVVVVTNQSGVARGYYDEEFVERAHRHLTAVFASGGARIDASYYCPHHQDAAVETYRRQCECRKPRPGLVHRAATELDIDVARSFGVGDRVADVELAEAAGFQGILVTTGYGATEAPRLGPRSPAVPIVANLIEATTWILRNTSRTP